MVRVYSESIKKWAIAGGIGGTSLIGLYFLYLSMIGAITITGYSGDSVCAGTIEDPCYAYINFTANEDIFIYPTDYDPWGRNTPFEFDSNLKDWKLQRSWGTGWRTLPLNQSCTGTWCGLSSSKDTRVFSVAFRKGNNYQIRIVAYKNTPADNVKWSAFDGEIDPVWKGIVNVTLISNTDECFNCKTVFEICKLADLTDSQANIDFSFYNEKLNQVSKKYNLSVLRNVSYDIEVVDYVNITKEFKCNSTDFNYILDTKYACCKWPNINGTSVSFCHGFETGNIATKTIYWTEQIVSGSHTEQRTGLEWRPVTNAQIKNAFKAAPIGTCWNISLEGNLGWGENMQHTLEFGAKSWTEYTWWNNSWDYRKPINITNIASNPVLRKWFTVNMTVENLTGSGKMQADYDDVRVIYNGTGSDAELDRVITAYNSTHFLIEFAVQANITNGTSSTNEYWLYYGNAGASAPTINKSKVYLFYCDFSSDVCGLTEQDANNYITYNATAEHLNFDLDRDADAYIYILLDSVTRGAKVTGYQFDFDFKLTYAVVSGSSNFYAGLGNNVLNDYCGGYHNLVGACWFEQQTLSDGTMTRHSKSGGSDFSAWVVDLEQGVQYYITQIRIGSSNLNNTAYTDSTRTTVRGGAKVLSGTEEYNYFFVINNCNVGSAANDIEGYIDNVKLIRRITTNPTYVLGAEEEMPITYTMSGTVQDSIGVMIANATVYIIDQIDNNFIINLTTNSSGGWTYDLLGSSNYSVCAHNPKNVSQGGDCKPFIAVS